MLHVIDYVLIILYVVFLVALGTRRRLKKDSLPSELIVGGRMLTLPAFVASLVTTWYGGILGVGEYSFRYGISNWIVFGLPYYVAAFLFALFLARKARESEALTIPDRLAQVYDNRTAVAGSIVVYLMTVPTAYVLILGVLCERLFGWPFWMGAVLGTLFSAGYVYFGGFRSVIHTDLFQFVLMFLGFVVLLAVLVHNYGGVAYLQANLPETHLTWHGGKTIWYIATWYVIALATLIEPAFFQRCYAARTAATARTGIYVSIGCWAFFDFLTTSCGLYARAVLPDLPDPVSSYLALAMEVLPAGLVGLLALALLSTVMSTVESYAFLAASTFGNDIVRRLHRIDDRGVTMWTRCGLLISSVLAVLLTIYFRSVVEIWYVFGSVGTAALLIPVFSTFVGRRRLPSRHAFYSIIISGAVSLLWYVLQDEETGGAWWHQVPLIFPGLFCSVVVFLMFSGRCSEGLPHK